jgi:phosphopantothenoylcysteine decarboxylase/phosphopantothenate--cysteine ligase
MSKGTRTLEGRLIVLGVTGSIAAVESVRLAHALRRRGARVQGVITAAGCGIIHPDALTYATGQPAITRCTGMVEHVTFCGIDGDADCLCIAPCTANTLCKIAAGIDDTPVTTFATTAIGRGMPIVIVPAMHESMYRHPAVKESIARLASWGIDVVDPRIEEGKAKIADIGDIVLHTERAVLAGPLKGKRVLITSGPCQEPFDDVRVLTTRSSGKMGREIALQAYRLGAEVTVVHNGHIPCVTNVQATSAADMRSAVHALFDGNMFDIYISAAALSDFAPQRHAGKLPSGEPVTVTLDPLPKLIEEVVERYNPLVVAFKLGWDEEEKIAAMLEQGIDIVIANTPEAMGADTGVFTFHTREGQSEIRGSKEEVAATLWTMLQ